jgi:hypothetical protein
LSNRNEIKIGIMKTQEILENIKRLEKTISMNIWNKVYVSNCKEQIENYKKQLENANNI